jgi:hypothetical protein
MKVTRIEIEGRAGRYATVTRKDGCQTIDITVLTLERPEGTTAKASATNEESQRYMAAWLHKALEGYEGAAGDIADYLRVIQTFAD